MISNIELTLEQWRAAIDIFGHEDHIQNFLNNLEEHFSYAFDTSEDGESGHYSLELDVKYQDSINYFAEVRYKVEQDDPKNHKTKMLRLDKVWQYAYIDNEDTGLSYSIDITDEVNDILDVCSDRYKKYGSPYDDTFEYIHGGL